MILLRLALRRDRIMLPVWIYLLVAIMLGTASSFRSLYPHPADRNQFAAALAGNRAVTAIYGPLPTPTSLGELVAWRSLVLGGIALSVLVILVVVRHTRADEQSGALELLSATAISRTAALTAALTTVAVAVLGLDVLLVVGGVLVGLPALGCLNFAAAWTGLAFVFAGVAAVTAQLAENARTARAVGFLVLALAYLLRLLADAEAGWLTWLSPLGWAQRMQSFHGDRWWPLVLPLAAGGLLIRAGFRLQQRRDLGAGLLAARSGRPAASPWLRSSAALTIRTARAGWLGWLVAVVAFGALFGGIASSVTALGDSAATRKLLAELGGSSNLADGFIGSCLNAGGLILTGYGLSVLVAAQSEESSGRLELLLAGPIRRGQWFIGQLATSLIGTGLLLAAVGLMTGLTRGEPGRVLAAGLVLVPAAWVIVSVSALCYGLARTGATLGWAGLGVAVVLGLLGPVLKFPQWLLDVSPFAHVPTAPGQPVSAPAVIMMLGITLALGAGATWRFSRRDLG